MREIKFRVYDDKLHTMKDVIYIDYPGKKVIYRINDDGLDVYKPFNEVDIMQYTGFKDKNEVEIYGGDILDFILYDYNGRGTQYRGYVYMDRYGTFIKTSLDEDEFTETFDFVATIIQDSDDLEVIGNIYENPELLEEY